MAVQEGRRSRERKGVRPGATSSSGQEKKAQDTNYHVHRGSMDRLFVLAYLLAMLVSTRPSFSSTRRSEFGLISDDMVIWSPATDWCGCCLEEKRMLVRKVLVRTYWMSQRLGAGPKIRLDELELG